MPAHMHLVHCKVMSFWQGERFGEAFEQVSFIKAGLAVSTQAHICNVCDCALLCNKCVICVGCDIILNSPACFLISLQEGSSADSESVPQKVVHTHPVYYKHQAGACLSSLYFVLLSQSVSSLYFPLLHLMRPPLVV